ncbi:MAG: hypothetical protein ACYC9I_09005 [Desulfuromonadales bacterium]
MVHHTRSNQKGGSGRSLRYFSVAALALLTGCSSLLPSSKEDTISSWHRFEQAKAAYDQITPGNSQAELRDLGFDLANSPNVEVLSYVDLAGKFQTIPMTELAPGLQECLRSREECQAYVYDLRRLRAKRVGKFWPDFLNFRRKTDSTGWRFSALLVMVNDRVTYKLWSGTPRIEIYKEDRNPLGPLQGSGNQVLNLLPWK